MASIVEPVGTMGPGRRKSTPNRNLYSAGIPSLPAQNPNRFERHPIEAEPYRPSTIQPNPNDWIMPYTPPTQPNPDVIQRLGQESQRPIPEFTPEPVRPTKGTHIADAATAALQYMSRRDSDVDRWGAYQRPDGAPYGTGDVVKAGIPGTPNAKRINDAIVEIQRRAAIDQLGMPQSRLHSSGQDMESALKTRGMTDYPLDIPVDRRVTDYPTDIPMGWYPQDDTGRYQRELDLWALTDGLKNQRDLDAQYLGIDMTPKVLSSGIRTSTESEALGGDNNLPVKTSDQQSAVLGGLGSQIAPGSLTGKPKFGSADYGSPTYGGYLAPELIALKAKLANSYRMKQRAMRDRAMYHDDASRDFNKKINEVGAQYNRRGLGPDTGLISRDKGRLGESHIRGLGRYDISYGDYMEDRAVQDDAARRQAFLNAMQKYQADVALRAAMKPNIMEAF